MVSPQSPDPEQADTAQVVAAEADTDPVGVAIVAWRLRISKGVGLVVAALIVLGFVLGAEATTPILGAILALMVLLLIGQVVTALVLRSRRRSVP
ncbi:MAG TPA: hypothetical protein IAA98_01295 [Candidatus Avipropionibacterium avicola]|uniref:Uncharacterized protein n=1 Tax=Candidatus Avipropionibacterium avicola TaxID=2840701 RepID=A0A9D1KL38_9ACTN|nr:hypothetical protein [Candidatus Avipropionibacterium avicola]